MPWWAVTLIAVAALLAGGAIVYVAVLWYLSRGLRG